MTAPIATLRKVFADLQLPRDHVTFSVTEPLPVDGIRTNAAYTIRIRVTPQTAAWQVAWDVSGGATYNTYHALVVDALAAAHAHFTAMGQSWPQGVPVPPEGATNA